MKRGDVFWADLVPRSGSEQSGRRPVIVVSNDGFNSVPSWLSVIVVPISTSSSQARRGPSSVPISLASSGLNQDSFALCHQITTLDRSKLTKHIGFISPSEMDNLEAGIKAALELF